MNTRREVLLWLSAAATGALALPAKQRTERSDVSYLWHQDLGAVLDYMEEVERVLGPEVGRKLRVVKGGSNFGLVYDRNGDLASSNRVAQRHSELLTAADLEPATPMVDDGYHDLFNVSYGIGPNLDVQIRNFATLYRELGPGVGKQLTIDRTDDGQYALVYKRRGDLESTLEVAGKHARVLRGSRIDATIIREQNHVAVYGENSLLGEEVERAPPLRVSAPEDQGPAISTPRAASALGARAPDLEQQIAAFVESCRGRTLDRSRNAERTAWSVFDFTSGEKLVAINEDVPMQCASMVKPLVALAFFHQVSRRKLLYGPASKRYMEAMIQRSSNAATNWVMQNVGGPRAVQQILTGHYGDIFRQTSVVEHIPPGGRTYRNVASAHDYSRFLYALWNGALPHAQEIRRLMALPNRDRIYHGASMVPPGTFVIDKTGTTGRAIGNFGILLGKGRDGQRYAWTIVGLTDRGSRHSNFPYYVESRSDIIRGVSNRVYENMRIRHNLI